MTPETEITRGGEWEGGGVCWGCKTKNLLWSECENFLEQHISCKTANDETIILTNLKATQAKAQKIVVAKSLITNAHAMIITSDIRRLPYRGYTPCLNCTSHTKLPK